MQNCCTDIFFKKSYAVCIPLDAKPVDKEKPAEGADITKGQRNNALASIAGAMRRQGCNADEIHTALINVNNARCRPPLGFNELKRIAESISAYPHEQKQEGLIILNDDNPDTIASAFEKTTEVKHAYNLVDGWSIFKDGRYRSVEGAEIQVYLRRFLDNVRIRGNEFNYKYKRSRNKICDVMAELSSLNRVQIPKKKHSPCSLDDRYKPRDIIAMKNCLLDISVFPPRELPLTNKFYTLNYLPFNYDPSRRWDYWLEFLSTVFTIDRMSKDLVWDTATDDFVPRIIETADEFAAEILQEWFGYFSTADTHQQKIFGLVGPRRSGKSTIARVLRQMVGPRNVASPTLTSLSNDFALQPLLNKSLAIIGDANTTGRNADIAKAVERLKSISGEDGQQINRKRTSFIEVEKLPTRILMVANKMQDLRDSTGALASRFNFLITTQSFLGREDTHLEKKLLAELPGIFNWSLIGLQRLRERGYFLNHPAGLELKGDFEEMSSPITAFINDWCVIKKEACVPIEVLWQAHCTWAKENGNNSYSKRKFIIEIKGACSTIKRERLRFDLSQINREYKWDCRSSDNRLAVLSGIDLREDCKFRWNSEDNGPGYGLSYHL